MPTLGMGDIPFEAVKLVTAADGVYTVMAGTGPLRDKKGNIVTLRVYRASETGLDANGLPVLPGGFPVTRVPAPGGGR